MHAACAGGAWAGGGRSGEQERGVPGVPQGCLHQGVHLPVLARPQGLLRACVQAQAARLHLQAPRRGLVPLLRIGRPHACSRCIGAVPALVHAAVPDPDHHARGPEARGSDRGSAGALHVAIEAARS
jgi:hypothetical protein